MKYAGRKMETPEAHIATLQAALEATDDATRSLFTYIFTDIGTEEALDMVSRYVQNGNAILRTAAIAELGKWRDPVAIDTVLDLASASSDAEQRVSLMNAFGDLIRNAIEVDDGKKLDQCRRALEIGLDANGKRALLNAIGNIMDVRALELIEELGKDPELAEDAKRAAPAIKQKLLSDPVLTASHNPGDVNLAIDGDPNSRWTTNEFMKPGMWFAIDLRMQSEIYGITLDCSGSNGDYPRKYDVYISDKPEEKGELAVTGAGNGPVTKIEFNPPVKGRYIKIVQTGNKDDLYWSIHELTVNHDPGFDSIAAPTVSVENLLDGDKFITAWNVAGPFTKTGKDGGELFNTVFGPEMDVSMALWQPLKSEVIGGGLVDLEKLSGGDNSVAYLVTCLVTEKPMRVTLSMGSDDGIKAWLNGKLVHANMVVRPLSPDTDKVAIDLEKGENILLLKVVDASGQWGACARILPEGK